MMAKIQALLLGEWYPDCSDRENYEYLALHYSFYNWFAENVKNIFFKADLSFSF
jgi:hypothetical protein